MPNPVIAALKKATQGLSLMSEKDAPFKTVSWPADGKLSKKKVVELGKHAADSPVEEMTLDALFAPLVKDQDWFGKAEKAAAEKYRQLLKTFRENLSEPKVYKVGQAKKKVYILGKDKDGNWTGLSTDALET